MIFSSSTRSGTSICGNTTTSKQGDTLCYVLRGISLVCLQGTSYAITGISGAGKSTLLHLLAGIDSPTTGFVAFNDQDIACFTSRARSLFLNQSVGLVFQ